MGLTHQERGSVASFGVFFFLWLLGSTGVGSVGVASGVATVEFVVTSVGAVAAGSLAVVLAVGGVGGVVVWAITATGSAAPAISIKVIRFIVLVRLRVGQG